MTQEQCLVLIKPDGMVKELTGSIIDELSRIGVHIVAAKVVQVSRELAQEHYRHLKDKAFFEDLIRYIMGEYHTKRVMALVYEGDNAVAKIREASGATHPEEAQPTSIRGKFGRVTKKGVFENCIHASENPKEAEREIKLWFTPEEIIHTIYPVETKEMKQKVSIWKEV